MVPSFPTPPMKRGRPSGGSTSNSFVTAVRVRPMLPQERADGCSECLDLVGCTVSLTDPATRSFMPPEMLDTSSSSSSSSSSSTMDQFSRSFTFDHSFDSRRAADDASSNQAAVFDKLGTFLVKAATDGYNCSLFAYGQTGSGKSYTVLGTGGVLDESVAEEDYGVVPRLAAQLFEAAEVKQRSETTLCWVEASFLEIYNERVRDLFGEDVDAKAGLRIREHPATGPYVQGLEQIRITSLDHMKGLIQAGSMARTVASTRMNESSSRSHAVFTVKLVQVRRWRIGWSEGERVRGRGREREQHREEVICYWLVLTTRASITHSYIPLSHSFNLTCIAKRHNPHGPTNSKGTQTR